MCLAVPRYIYSPVSDICFNFISLAAFISFLFLLSPSLLISTLTRSMRTPLGKERRTERTLSFWTIGKLINARGIPLLKMHRYLKAIGLYDSYGCNYAKFHLQNRLSFTSIAWIFPIFNIFSHIYRNQQKSIAFFWGVLTRRNVEFQKSCILAFEEQIFQYWHEFLKIHIFKNSQNLRKSAKILTYWKWELPLGKIWKTILFHFWKRP